MFELKNLADNAQSALFVIMAESALKLSENEEVHEVSKKALNIYWKWVEDQKISGDELYDLIDSGDKYDMVDLQSDIASDIESDILDCVINAVLYTSRKAYDYSNEYLPQAVEGVKETLYDDTKKIFISLDNSFAHKMEVIENYFQSNNVREFSDKAIMSFLDELLNSRF